MLVLVRRVEQKLIVGDDVTITILGMNDSGSQVKVGIDAPDHINIVRTELLKSGNTVHNPTDDNY
jgi:carbon storage regulator